MSVESGNPYQAPALVEPSETAGDPLVDGRLQTTGFGLKLIYWGIALVILGWVLMVPVAFLSDASNPILMWATAGVSLVGFLLANVGPLLCLTVPSGTGLRPWAIVTVLTQVLVMAGIFLQGFVIGFPVVSGIWIFMLLGGTVFLAFLNRLSRALSRPDLVRRCRNVFLIGVGVVIGGFVLTLFLLESAPSAGYMMLVPIGLLLGGLVLTVAYANVVNAIANAILKPPARAGGDAIA